LILIGWLVGLVSLLFDCLCGWRSVWQETEALRAENRQKHALLESLRRQEEAWHAMFVDAGVDPLSREPAANAENEHEGTGADSAGTAAIRVPLVSISASSPPLPAFEPVG
jgi:hypothetical protein